MSQISVIIPTLNEIRYLPNLISDLKSQSLQGFEIIVSDAGSTDGTLEYLEKENVKVVGGGIQSVGRNNGALLARGDILLFLDADVRISEDFLSNSFSGFQKENLDISNSRFDIAGLAFYSKLTYIFSDFTKIVSSYLKIGFGSGECIWVKKEFFIRAGGFSADLKIGEDVEFITKVLKLKGKYGILKTKFKPSDRRFLSVSAFRVVLASVLNVAGNMVGLNKVEQVKVWLENFMGDLENGDI